MQGLKKLLRNALKRKEKLSKFERQTRRFKRAYPQYEIGRGSYGLPLIHPSHGGATLKIGAFCSISSNVQIYLGGNHRSDWVTTSPLNIFFEQKNNLVHETTKGNVNIGNDVWICGNAVILSGVTIGHGAVIGNSAVVSRDVAPYSIVAGNPAKHIRYRFEPETIEQLLSISWWDWSEEDLRKHSGKLLTQNIHSFLKFTEFNKKP